MHAAFKPAIALFLAASGPALAADDLKTFLSAFADALDHGDEQAAAGMSQFPLKNEVYQEGKTIAKSEFKRHFGLLKSKEFVKCLKTTKPERAQAAYRDLGSWVVDCNGNDFYFAQVNGAWRYSGYGNVNE